MANEPSPSAGSATGASNTRQYGRVCKLVVSNKAGAALDLSALRIKFAVKKSGIMTPNVADILVYNMDETTAGIVKKEFTHVRLEAGYVGNSGVIFDGNIKWATVGRENATDTFLSISAGDGDVAYNFAVITQPVAAGSLPADQLNRLLMAMQEKGVKTAFIGPLPQKRLARGKVMYGSAKDYINTLAQSLGFTWSIQDGGVVFISKESYLPGEAVVLSSKTGMVGTPVQTIEGIMCKTLLNPKLKCHGRAKIDNKLVQAFKINFLEPGSAANTPVPLTNDGLYYILVAEHFGDTRGPDWHTHLQLLGQVPASNPLNSKGLGV